jgi:hypothetical protein
VSCATVTVQPFHREENIVVRALSQFGQHPLLLYRDASAEAQTAPARRAAPRNLGYRLDPACGAARRQRFDSALRLAVRLARAAGTALTPGGDETTVAAARRISPEARRLFIYFFGTTPEHKPSWAAPRTAAGLVGRRFKSVARELGGGRRITYTCGGATGTCAGTRAITMGKSAVTLCDDFWGPNRSLADMAGTLLHEGMHAVYWDLFDHSVAPGIAECRRDNARCFQGFALRLGGFGAADDIRSGCRRTPLQCRPVT